MKAEGAAIRAARESAATPAGSTRAGIGANPDAEGAASAEADLARQREETFYRVSFGLLGGRKYWPRRVASRADIHDAIVQGIAYGSLLHLVSHMHELEEGDIAKVLGISSRTLRRQAKSPQQPMPPDLASKAWLFAETLAKATEVFGSKDEAELWMSRPAMGLDGQRPIDLLQTVQGAELVSDFLGRLEYGVYT